MTFFLLMCRETKIRHIQSQNIEIHVLRPTFSEKPQSEAEISYMPACFSMLVCHYRHNRPGILSLGTSVSSSIENQNQTIVLLKYLRNSVLSLVSYILSLITRPQTSGRYGMEGRNI